LLTVSNREKQAQAHIVCACNQVKVHIISKYAPAPIELATHVDNR
jgi:hypothetical protein